MLGCPLMAVIITLWDCEHKSSVIEFEMEWISEAMNKILMIAFGMYCKELWGPQWLSLLMREQRGTAMREGERDQKFIGGWSKSSSLSVAMCSPHVLSLKSVNENTSLLLLLFTLLVQCYTFHGANNPRSRSLRRRRVRCQAEFSEFMISP